MRISIPEIRKAVIKDEKGVIKKQMTVLAKQKWKEFEDKMLKKFNDHEVTRAIESQSNIGELLVGVKNYGEDPNLFSYIGFKQGDQPITDLRRYIFEGATRLEAVPVKLPNNQGLTYRFKGFLAGAKEILRGAPYPDNWKAGSWAIDIETDIPGIQYYLSQKFDKTFSRSKEGIQAKEIYGRGSAQKDKLRPISPQAMFKPRPYLTEIFNEFRRDLDSKAILKPYF